MRKLWLVAALLVAVPAPVVAKSEKTVVYGVAKVFPAAVRFLRVDEGVKIIEKDPDNGYVMFELKEEGKTFPGALEMIEAENAGRPAVKLVLRIEDRPSYVEQAMLERLERKLRAELGSEPPPIKPEKPAPVKPTPPSEDKKTE